MSQTCLEKTGNRPERRVFFGEVKLEERVGSDYPCSLIGYAAVFYRKDDPGTEYDVLGDGSVMERLAPGCFDRALREMDVIGCFNHDLNLILGRKSAGTMRLGVTEIGLQYMISPGDQQYARDLVASVRRGDVTGSSFSFVPNGKEGCRYIPQLNGSVVRELRDIDIFDCGPVSLPAYSSTSVGMRALGDLAEVRQRIQADMGESLPVDSLHARARAMEISALYSF